MLQTREQLIHLLTEAAEVEHNILCSYLYAAFSMKIGTKEGLTEREAEVVAQWRKIVLGVAVEEMGHLAIVNNLLVAVGGSPHFDRPNLPLEPGYHPSCFVVRLTPFDEATLDHFIYLERPEEAPLGDPEQFNAVAELPREPPSERLTPHAADYETIAQLYQAIREMLGSLVQQRGGEAFVGSTEAGQLDPEIMDMPGLAVITDLPSALRALDTIVEQGEGAPHAREDSHFARYNGIKREWEELKKNNPDFVPAFPAAQDPVMRRPVDPGERVWIIQPDAVLRLDLANAMYAQVVTLLVQSYDPVSDKDTRRAFVDAAILLMQGVSVLGQALARLPANPDYPGVNAGMTFAVPRNLGLRPPHSATSTILERLEELRDTYDEFLGTDPESPVAKAHRRIKRLTAPSDG